MKKYIGILILLLTFGFAGNALAQDAGPMEDAGPVAAEVAVPDLEEDPGGFFSMVYERLHNGEWLMAFGGMLILIVFLVRKVLSKWIKWFDTKLGGYTVSFGTAMLLALGTALLAGQGISIGLMLTAVSVAFAASGGWEAVNDLLKRNKEEVVS